jgi:tetratricopeptide (TPR) repeat protein
MSYPGNPSISLDTQRRLLQTFDQTLDLASKGSRQEALLGCDFILRMDPAFEPARTLFDRLGRGSGPVPVDDLRLDLEPSPENAAPSLATMAIPSLAAPEPDELSFADLEGGLDGGGLNAFSPSPEGDLRSALQEALSAGRYSEALTLAGADPAAVAKDPELRKLAARAQEHAESEPYVRRFLDQARLAVQSGNEDEVSKMLVKARTLNPEHPGLAEIEQMRANYAGAARMGGRRQGIELDAEPEAEALPAFDLAADEGAGELTLEDEEGLPPGLQLLDDEPAEPPAGPGPATGAASDSDKRIAELLDEGQEAFDRGEHQAAIDAWSRIFLIDIDHSEAARRIELARKLKAESERQVEEIFHEGAAHLDAGELSEAQAAFRKVLELQPGHLAAREMLQRAEAPPQAPGRRPSPSAVDMSPIAPAKADAAAPARPATRERPAAAAAPRPAGPSPIQKKAPAKRTFMMVGGAVLVLALGAGAFLWRNWDRFFPNRAQPAQAPAATDAIARATKLHDEGKSAVAIAQLRRLPPEDPQYDRAQALIQQWEAAAAPATPALAPADVERRAGLVESARAAYANREYMRAESLFEQAGAVAPLDATTAELLADAKRQLQPLADQIGMFKQGDWEFVLPNLWRAHESDPQNADITHMIVDSYYNLAVRDLQREDPRSAGDKLKEALQLAPQDPEVRRLSRFAEQYRERAQDLLYRVFVKYLAFR